MSDFAENLRKAMFAKRLKGVDVANATKITPSVISRYLTGAHQPSTDNLLAISKYLGISPEALLSSSEAPELSKSSKYISSDKDKVIAVQEELIKKYKQENAELRQILEGVQLTKKVRQKPYAKEWEERKQKKRWEEAREKAKNPKYPKPKKTKVGFLRKHKPKK